MVWALLLVLAGGALAYIAIRSEQRSKLHLSRNNWSSFWNGAVAASGSFLALTNLLVLMRGF